MTGQQAHADPSPATDVTAGVKAKRPVDRTHGGAGAISDVGSSFDFSELRLFGDTSARRVEVSQPGDRDENEADRIADVALAGAPPARAAAAPMPTPTKTGLALRGGVPLPAEVRADLEPRFGQNFSRVRIHTDERAANAARGLSARAFTIGNDLAFGRGQFQPATAAGRRLLAHELAHVVQQSSPAASAPPRVQRQATTDAAPVEAISLQQQENDALRRPVPEGLPKGVSIQRRQDVQCGSKFVDAELNQDGQGRATLTISVRSWFVFMPIGKPWSMAEQKSWQETFVRKVTDKWSFKHYLEPTELCPDLPVPRVAVNVRCVPVPAGAPRHLDVVVYRNDEAPDRSSVGGVGGTVSHSGVNGGRPKPSHAANMRVRESDIDEDIGGYVTAEHEFGHALGLNHIACPANDDKCYGRGDEASDVMGNGPTIGARDYEPFAALLGREFAPGCTWKVTEASAPPRNIAPLVFGLVGGALGVAAGAALGFLAGGPLGAFLGGIIGGLAVGGAGALLGHFSGTQL